MVGASDCGIELLLTRPRHICKESLKEHLIFRNVCMYVVRICVYVVCVTLSPGCNLY